MFGFSLTKQKKYLFALLSLFIFGFLQQAHANSYIVVDSVTNRVLEQHQPFKRWYPASLTKLMTAYLAFDALREGHFTITSPIYISKHAKAAAPVRSNYEAGTYVPFITALQLVLVHSTNDLAVALAEAIGGNEANFVKEMNDTAQKIGMTRSHFTNPHGLFNKDHYSTAYDLALLAVKIRHDFPQYAYFFKIEGIDMPDSDKIIKNSNNLLGRFPGADGLKTGFTCASGYNLAASATRGNRKLIAVVLGSPTIEDREVLTAKLLSEGFSTKGTPFLTLATLKPKGTDLDEALDMRPLACSIEAHKRNYPYIRAKNKAPFPSPYLASKRELTNIIQVKNFSNAKNPLVTP